MHYFIYVNVLMLRRACRERGALLAVGESLVREIARLRQDLETRSVVISELQEIHDESERNRSNDVSTYIMQPITLVFHHDIEHILEY